MVVDTPLVSVVIPAYNASETIRETLASASGQTYGNLDIVVVDDGSRDDTGAIVHQHSLHDPRVRLVEKSNGGVASARNAGIRASRGTLVAFLDADDLWHPTKVSKQVEVLLAGGEEMALVYAPFRVIDINGKVLLSPRKYGASGWVLHRHFYVNLIGNGSSILVRKSVLDEVGGFDPQLREAGAEGCEDLLLQLRVAARYRFGLVQEYLIGYRRRPASMSSNADQMIRSGALASRIALSECRHLSRLPRDAILNRHEWQRLRHAARQGDIVTALGCAWQQFTGNPALAAAALWNDVLQIVPRLADLIRSELADKLGSSPRLRHFYDYDPAMGIDRARPCPRAFRRLALMDLEYRPRSGSAAPVRLANTLTDMATTR